MTDINPVLNRTVSLLVLAQGLSGRSGISHFANKAVPSPQPMKTVDSTALIPTPSLAAISSSQFPFVRESWLCFFALCSVERCH